jgi:hypothetical protein
VNWPLQLELFELELTGEPSSELVNDENPHSRLTIGAGGPLMTTPCPRRHTARADLAEWVSQYNEEALLADGFEDAVIGVAQRCSCPALVVYDAERCVEILMNNGDMSYEDALEFFDFNTLGAWAGEGTPLFLWRREDDL